MNMLGPGVSGDRLYDLWIEEGTCVGGVGRGGEGLKKLVIAVFMPLLKNEASCLFIEQFGIEGVAGVGIGAERHVIIGCPSRLWFGATFGFVVGHTMQNEEEVGFAELMVVEGRCEYFCDGGFIGWFLGRVCLFWVSELKKNFEVVDGWGRGVGVCLGRCRWAR